MLTKFQYCQSILEDYAYTHMEEPNKVNESDIYNSTSLAVAMEFLGLLQTNEVKEYASTRVGTVVLTNHGKALTVRELISLLPDEPN